jgi:hypothetical protein
VRRATVLVVLALALAACDDIRDFRGTWQGARVGDVDVLRVGSPAAVDATLEIDSIDTHGLVGRVAVDGLVAETALTSLPGAEADAVAGMTFAGSPLRVYLAFVDTSDGGGAALAMVALYTDHRIELRLMRGNPHPLYAIYLLAAGPVP